MSRIAEKSLFAVLLRSPWWVSLPIAAAPALLAVALLPAAYLTVREHLVAFTDNRDGQRDEWTLERICALCPRLRERASHMGNEFSGGEQQMVAIDRALSTNPRLRILDEATEGQSPVIGEEISECLRTSKEAGQTTLLADRHIETLLRLADRHLVLERGQMAWSGTSYELAGDRSIWSRYLGV